MALDWARIKENAIAKDTVRQHQAAGDLFMARQTSAPNSAPSVPAPANTAQERSGFEKFFYDLGKSSGVVGKTIDTPKGAFSFENPQAHTTSMMVSAALNTGEGLFNTIWKNTVNQGKAISKPLLKLVPEADREKVESAVNEIWETGAKHDLSGSYAAGRDEAMQPVYDSYKMVGKEKFADYTKTVENLGTAAFQTAFGAFLGDAVSGATSGISWLQNAPKWVQGGVNAGLTLGAMDTVKALGEEDDVASALKRGGISALAGFAGGAAGSAIGGAGAELLKDKSWEFNKLARAAVSAISAAGFATGSTGVNELAKYLEYPEGYKPDGKQITTDFVAAIAFATLMSLLSATPNAPAAEAVDENIRPSSEYFDRFDNYKDANAEFRRLALELHPDLNPGNAEAEAKLKQISGEWDTLRRWFKGNVGDSVSNAAQAYRDVTTATGADASAAQETLMREVANIQTAISEGLIAGDNVDDISQILSTLVVPVGTGATEVLPLLPEQSAVAGAQGLPMRVDGAEYKVVEIPQSKIDEISAYIDKLDNASAKKKYKRILKNLFMGQKFTNVNTVANDLLYEIGLGSKGIGEIINRQPVNAETLAVLERLNDVIENAKYTASEPSTSGSPLISRTDNFETNTMVGDKPGIAKMRVNVTPEGNKLYYATNTTEQGATPAPRDNQSYPRGNRELHLATDSILPNSGNSNNNLPNGTGAMRARFPYVEAPTQHNSTNGVFNDYERSVFEELGNPTHKRYSNAESLSDARERMAFDYDAEKDALMGSRDWGAAETHMAHQFLADAIEKARAAGDIGAYADAIELAKKYHEMGALEGQALQARRPYADSPELILAGAADTLTGDRTRKMTDEHKSEVMRQIEQQMAKYEGLQDGDTDALIALIGENSAARGTTGLFTKKTSALMKSAMNELLKTDADGEYIFDDPEGFLRDVALSQINNMASDYLKLKPLDAIKSYRRMGMLSKINTVLRNLVGNNVFDPLDALSNNMAVPLDALLSKKTGTRSIAFDKSWFSHAKRHGSLEGMIKSYIQVGLDADVGDTQSKYGLRPGRSFKMTGNPLERFLSTWEKVQGYLLQSTDEFQKGGISAEAQRGIDLQKEKGNIAPDALKNRADTIAKERTFQQDSIAANAVIGVRRGLNYIGSDGAAAVSKKVGLGLDTGAWGSLGAGDIVIPFAQVPANIATQAINYSPAGLVNGIKNIAVVLKKAHDGTLTPELQAKAVTDVGRGLTGLAGIAIFATLALKGILSVAGSGDADRDALDRAEGKQGTQFNVSALTRWVKGEDTEWRKDDDVMSIGFLDPINAQMAAGAMIADSYDEDDTFAQRAGKVTSATMSATIQAVLDLPAMSQMNDLINTYRYSSGDNEAEKLADAGIQYGASQLSSFLVPNVVRGVATGTDDVVRDTSADTPFQSAINSMISGVPGLRQTLPPAVDSLGREREYPENPITHFLNSNILPGSMTKYNVSDINKELSKLSDDMDTSLFPNRKAPNSFTVDGEKLQLNADEKREYQTVYGQTANKMISSFFDSAEYKKLPDSEKADVIRDIYSFAIMQAKQSVSDYSPDGWLEKADGFGRAALTYIMYRNAWNDAADAKDSNAVKAGVAADIADSKLKPSVKEQMYEAVAGNKGYEAYKGTSVPAGVFFDVYYYSNTVKTVVAADGREVKPKEQTLAYIDRQKLTVQQKDELYLACGYAESTLRKDAPWH